MKIIEVYTDGACTQGNFMPWPGGWAVLIMINGQKVLAAYDGKAHTTNNEMELTAFLQGLKLVEQEFGVSENNQVVVFTDSAYITNCFKQKWYEKWMQNGWMTASNEPVKNIKLWIEIFDMVKKLKPAISKVKAHTNNEYNIYVDKLAVEAKEEMVRQNENDSYIG
jgi:ribonuclease HI